MMAKTNDSTVDSQVTRRLTGHLFAHRIGLIELKHIHMLLMFDVLLWSDMFTLTG